MDYTKSVGNVTELQCLSKFISMGFDCAIPYGDASKYDFVVDLNGEFIRVQCKTAREVEDGVFLMTCYTQTTNTKETVKHRYTHEDIDYFATYYKGKVYVWSLDESSSTKTLRLFPPNNGSKEWNNAADYEIEKVFGYLQKDSFLEQCENRKNQIKSKQIKKKSTIYYCEQCGKNQVFKKNGVCSSCASLNRRKAERPTREELKKLVKEESFLSLEKRFGVSDNAIRKWCRAYNLPSKSHEIKNYSMEEWNKL